MKKKVFLFSGLGSQTLDMGWKLYTENSIFRNIMDDLNASLKKLSGISVIDNYYESKKENIFFSSQSMLFMTQYSLACTFIEMGMIPDALAGYSLGEFIAGAVSGAMSAKEFLGILYEQSILIEEKCCEGAALFVNATPETFNKYKELFLINDVEIINEYSKNHFIISSLNKSIEIIEAELKTKGILSCRLPVFYAFHTHLIDIISNDINTVYNKLNFSTPQIHIISSVDGYDFFEANPAYLWSIIRRPIRYTKAIKQCIDYDSILIDCSPLGSCSNFVKYNFKEVRCVVSMLDSHICKKLRISSLPEIKDIVSEQLE